MDKMRKISTEEELQNIEDSKFIVEAQSDAYWALIEDDGFEPMEYELYEQLKGWCYYDHIVKRESDGVFFNFTTSLHDTEGLDTDEDLEVTKVYPHKVVKIEYKPEPQTV